MKSVRKIVKALLPNAVVRHYLLSRDAGRLRDIYYGRQWRIMASCSSLCGCR